MMEIEIKGNKIKAPLKGKDVWLILKPEEHVRQKYICRLVNHYGFKLDQMEQEVLVSNTKRGLGAARADIIIYKDSKSKADRKNAVIVIECKADNIQIREEDYFQGANYASMCDAKFFVTTNLKETKIFKVVKGEIPKGLEEVINIPNADMLNDAKKLEALLKQTKSFTRDEFSKLLFKCHNIIRNNDKLSPEAAFDEISKILFIKIRYERDNNEGQIFSKERFVQNRKHQELLNKELGVKDAVPFYQQLFNRTKEDFKDDDLFEDNEILRIRENSFEDIVKELEIYNLSTTSDDVKGIAFEQFLGKTFRGELGQFFTPRTVVDFMVEILDPQESEVICDPCCGSGGFLIKAFEYVRSKIEHEIHLAKEKIKAEYYTENYENATDKGKEIIDDRVNDLFTKLNAELDINNEKSRIRELSYDCIFGTDANPRMSRTAKMNMIMHGDGHGGVHHNDGLLNVNGIFENRFDVILTNPPFGSRVEKTLKITEADKYTNEVRIAKYKKRYDTKENPAYTNALKQISDNINKPLLSLYKTGEMSTLTEVLFIERCLNLLKPGGRMGIVLPEGVLNNPNLQKIRDFVESQAKIVLITSIPQDVFIASGATVKPSLLFFKKFDDEEAEQYSAIVEQAKMEISKKYSLQTNPIKKQLSLSGKEALSTSEKKVLKAQLKQLEEKMADEIKAKIKKDFNYQVPIAEVEKAGISTTGAEIENELVPLSAEFKSYREANNLWHIPIKEINYPVENDYITRVRIYDGKVAEPELFYENAKV